MILTRMVVFAWLLVPSQVFAQELSLGQLHAQLMMQGLLVGEFSQCDRQKKAAVSGRGTFRFEPGHSMKLDFVSPRPSSVELIYKHGRMLVLANGSERKSSKAAALEGMIFSIFNLNEEVLNKKFKIDLQGSVEQFSITLKPKKRWAKLIKLVELIGSDGIIQMMHLTFHGGRILTLAFFPHDKKFSAVC